MSADSIALAPRGAARRHKIAGRIDEPRSEHSSGSGTAGGQWFAAITDIEVGPDDKVYVVDIALGRIWRIAGPVPVTLQDFRIE